jgi:hypothetical protein
LLREEGLDWACTWVGTLAASPNDKAIASIVKRDKRVNQAMIKISQVERGLSIKMAEQKPRFQHTGANLMIIRF